MGSFARASKLLDDIDKSVRENINSNTDFPSLALIGNKCDLEHLRKVKEAEGQRLAAKHGATFWEASASEDYYSTFRPLTSLIIKSFLRWKKSSSSPSSSGPEDDEIKSLLRRYNAPTNNSPRLISAPQLPPDYRRRGSDDNLTNNVTAPNFSSMRKTIKRRKKLREFKSKSMEKITSNSASSSSSSLTPATPATHANNEFLANNITIEVTDTSNEPTSSKITRNGRSQSLPKSNSSSFSSSSGLIQRKGKGARKNYTSSKSTSLMGIEKSHSFTDLKTLQYLRVDSASSGISSANSELALTSGESGVELNTLGRSSSLNALLGRSHSMRYSSSHGQLNGSSVSKSLSRSSSVRHAVSAEKLDDKKKESKGKLKSLSTTSFTALDESKNEKNHRRGVRKDRPKLPSIFLFEKTRDHNGSSNGKVERVPDTKQCEISNSKSMRRKFCNMLRPQSMNVSVN